MSQTVFISGANGFVAKHIILQLLESNYLVIGSVRSEDKGNLLVKQFSNSKFQYVVIKDLTDPEAFSVLKDHSDVSVFLHTASPFTLEEPDLDQLLGPAVDGTNNALTGIKKYGKNIKHVVITSSIASILNLKEQRPVYTEEHWGDVTKEDAKEGGIAGYYLSKKLAEETAWKFIKEEKPQFHLSTVLPGYVFGPQAFDDDITETLNVSAEFINSILLKGKLGLPYPSGFFIDVRDSAKAHIAAFEKDLQNRLVLTAEEFTEKDLIDILSKVTDKKLPEGEQIEKSNNINSDVTKKLLGFEYIKLEKTLTDAAKQILANQK